MDNVAERSQLDDQDPPDGWRVSHA
jgi:hypothetical protein